jgi:CheY-like chemotaxis protein
VQIRRLFVDGQLQQIAHDLRATIELGIENLRSRIDSKEQKLIVDLPHEPVIVLGDSVRLQQVFGNILNNAAKYTPVSGTITVGLAAENDSAVLRVRDNGAGIASDRLEWIFDLFTQAHQTLARTEGGLGVGLTVARRLIELHGGRIRAISEGLSKGSEFVLELPLVKGETLTSSPAPPFQPGTKKCILVIEDNDDAREMLVAALRLQGHEVFEAVTGRSGIEQVTLRQVDAVLVDIGLPDMLGYDVAKELRSKVDSSVRIIAITGYGAAADRAQSKEAGFHAHLLKPIDPVLLASALED